jgi:hypothetical protein
MIHPFPVAVAAAVLAAAPLCALAQASSPTGSASPKPAAKAAYTSAFDGYRRFDDQKVGRWRDANDNVGRIGGWQAYAREAAGEAAAPAPAQPASVPHDAHPGHGGHSMHKKP